MSTQRPGSTKQLSFLCRQRGASPDSHRPIDVRAEPLTVNQARAPRDHRSAWFLERMALSFLHRPSTQNFTVELPPTLTSKGNSSGFSPCMTHLKAWNGALPETLWLRDTLTGSEQRSPPLPVSNHFLLLPRTLHLPALLPWSEFRAYLAMVIPRGANERCYRVSAS